MSHPSLDRSRTLLVALGALAIAAAGVAAPLYWGPNHDVAWMLYIARRLADGAVLYRDIVEVNPPFTLALYALPELASRVLPAGAVTIFIWGVALLLAGSALAFARLLGDAAPDAGATARRVMGLVAVAALFPLVLDDYGQREHLMLALVLPYLALVAARASGAARPARLTIPIGVLAGLGIALKPYFLPLWLGMEGWLWLAARRRGTPLSPVRPESLAVAATGATLVALTLWRAPEYLALARSLRGVYGAFGAMPLRVFLVTPEAVLVAAAVVVALVVRRTAPLAALRGLLLVATLALFLAAAVQGKGWNYHFYPVEATALLLLTACALAARAPRALRVAPPAATAVALVATLATGNMLWKRAAFSVGDGSYRREVTRGELLPVVRRYAEGGSLLVLSTSMAPAFPLVNDADLLWASRFPSLWMIAALGEMERRLPRTSAAHPELSPDAQAAERWLLDAMGEDFDRYRPDVVLLPVEQRFDFVGYFSTDPRFAAQVPEYQYVTRVGGFGVFVRRTRLVAAR